MAYGHAPDRNDVMPDDDTDDDDEQAIDDDDGVDEGGGGGNLDNDSDDDVVFQAQLPPEQNFGPRQGQPRHNSNASYNHNYSHGGRAAAER